MISALIVMGALCLSGGLALAWAARKFAGNENALVVQIEELLPQTQCAQCGYPGCKPYAEAIVAGEADINQCQPGGERVVKALGQLLGADYRPPAKVAEKPMVAFIREAECIGCTLCIKACPVDCIIGAPKQMHTVITADCTGCTLCIPPCPVNCIDMEMLPPRWQPERP
ncbi:MAG: electron transport complex subunit RsxB [Proteobacteria bacterium]|nr:electron transport complex subunit RsxB [Pseudomonadota bacterium]